MTLKIIKNKTYIKDYKKKIEYKHLYKEIERIKRTTLVPYEHKEYDEKQLNELDYEEAVIYDKRNCCVYYMSLIILPLTTLA